MHNPVTDTWDDRDVQVLRVIVRAYDDSIGGPVRSTVVENALPDLTKQDIQRAGVALRDAGLIALRGASGTPFLFANTVSADARRIAGQWPSPQNGLERMIAALEAIAANTDEDEDTRTRARKILDGLLGGTKTVGMAMAVAYATGQIPGN